MHCDALARAYPTLRVDPDVLFVDDGDVVTSAGTAAGIDACLHLVRKHRGAAVASTIARRMVVPPQRDGGQRQYVDLPVPACSSDSLEPVMRWMREHLAQEQPVRELARRASMSERTFARRFVAESGTTPAKWLLSQRIHHARGCRGERPAGRDRRDPRRLRQRRAAAAPLRPRGRRAAARLPPHLLADRGRRRLTPEGPVPGPAAAQCPHGTGDGAQHCAHDGARPGGRVAFGAASSLVNATRAPWAQALSDWVTNGYLADTTWSLVAFLGGLVVAGAPGRRWSALLLGTAAGTLAVLLAVVAYYVTDTARGVYAVDESGGVHWDWVAGDARSWLQIGLVVGLALGFCGAVARRGGPLRWWALASLPLTVVARDAVGGALPRLLAAPPADVVVVLVLAGALTVVGVVDVGRHLLRCRRRLRDQEPLAGRISG